MAEGLIPAELEFVNADLFEAAQLAQVVDPKARSEQARLWADQRRATLLCAGRSFVSETVFSHPSKLQLLAACPLPPEVPPVIPGKLPVWAASVLAR